MINQKINVPSLGLAFGVFWAIGIGGITIASGLTNSPGAGEYAGYAGPLIKILMSAYPGYNISVPGIFIGVAWGLVDGFVSAATLAWFYNIFLTLFTGKKNKSYPSCETVRDIHVSM